MQRSSPARDRATLFGELERLYKLGRIDTKVILCPLNQAVDEWAADNFSVARWARIEDLMLEQGDRPLGWVLTDSQLRWPR
jgi:hypothetical protein